MPILPVPAAMQSSSRGFYPKTINGSLRFNDDDSAYLTKTFSTPTNNKIWTWSGWVKRNQPDKNYDTLFAVTDAKTFRFGYTGTDYILNFIDTNTSWYFTTNAKFRDPSAWYHIVLVVDTTQAVADDRTKVYVNGSRVTSFSAKTNPSQNAASSFNTTVAHYIGQAPASGHYLDGYLAEVFFIDGTAHTASDFGETKNGVWVPKNVTSTDFTMGTNGFHLTFEDDAEVEAFNTVLYKAPTSNTEYDVTGFGFTPDLLWIKNRDNVERHFLFDSVRKVDANRALVSSATSAEGLNGISGTTINLNSDGFTIDESSYTVGELSYNGRTYVAWGWDAGANNNITGHSSVTYTGNGGTQTIKGFPFSPDLVWIKGRSFVSGHQLYDTVRGATKRIQTHSSGAEDTQTAGLTSFDKNGFNLGSLSTSNTNGASLVAWAWDAGDSDPVSNTNGSITSTVKASTTNGFSIISYTGTGANATVGHGLSSAPTFLMCKSRTSIAEWNLYHSGLTTPSTYFMKLNNDEAENSNGAVRWNSTEPSSTVISLGSATDVNKSGDSHIIYAWHDVTGKQKFGSYTGDGGTSNSVTTGFRPGFVMIKRADGVANWEIYDSSRGSFTTSSQLYPNATDAEGANTIQFDSNGFTLTANRTNTNTNTGTYIYAAFAGSYSDYITDYNTDGTIDSRVKASDTTGFSVVNYIGNNSNSTIGHGLASAPDMIIAKSRSGAFGWGVYHSSVGYTKYLTLETTGGATTGAVWGTAAPTTSVFSISPGTLVNQSGGDYIAYCWTETTGVSKFGSYTGTGNSTGPTVSCGFAPALVIIKRTDSADNWVLLDNTRDVVNPAGKYLLADSSQAEATFATVLVDLNDTSFQPVGSANNINASGGTYIYAAFADTRDAAFWLDQSSNNNDWQPVNLDHNDTVLDSPTDNYATWNGVVPGNFTLSEGNLKSTVGANRNGIISSMGFDPQDSAGFKAEFTINTLGNMVIGLADETFKTDEGSVFATTQARTAIYGVDGTVYDNGSSQGTFSSFTAGDVVTMYVKSGSFYYAVNGTLANSGSAVVTGITDNTVFWLHALSGTTSGTLTANFGQQPFKYTTSLDA